MPYLGPDDKNLPANVRKLPAAKRKQWAAVWNDVYSRCQAKDGKDCEAAAFRAANGVVMAKPSTDELKTVNLAGVEIFATGTWNGDEYTAADLDAMVTAFTALQGELDPPVKLGHDDKQKLLQTDGYPAAGWVDKLYRKGTKLVADLRDVPAKIGELLKAGAYKKVSSEIYWDYKSGKKVYPRVLKAIAFLGADIPAVKSINDIRALYALTGGVAALYQHDGHLAAYQEEGGQMVKLAEFAAKAKADDDDPDEPVTLEELDSDLSELINTADMAVKGKTGAPAIRAFLKEVRGKLRSLMGKQQKAAPKMPPEDEEHVPGMPPKKMPEKMPKAGLHGDGDPAHAYGMPLFKTEAGYRDARNLEESCRMCRMFQPPAGYEIEQSGGMAAGRCMMVEGAIFADDTCERHEDMPQMGGMPMMGGRQMMTENEEDEMAVTEAQFTELQTQFKTMTERLDQADATVKAAQAAQTAAESAANAYKDRVGALETKLQASEDAREYADILAFTRTLRHVPGKPEDLATRLQKVKRFDEAEYTARVAEYKALDEASKVAFTEIGSNGTNGAGSTSEKLTSMAQAIAKEQKISFGDAWDQVCRDNVGMFKQYTKEARQATAVKNEED